ncbi:MAG: PEGA domain-containing protein [Deltaproteobacteria bacterium]|nr:PEGA domain-containing protein [Deltaproteobacteria bacterium]
MKARLVAPLIALLALALPAVARADEPPPPDAARAAELKRRGDLAMDTGNPTDAHAAYVEAYAITREPALLYNKGRALQALGDFPRALVELRAFQREAPLELKGRVPGLGRMIAELEARVTTVTVACDTMRAQITIRDRRVGECPLAEPLVLVSGRAKLEIVADGYFPYVREIDLPPGGASTFDVRLTSRVTSGVLVVRSSVSNAAVSIDGASSGMAPTETFVAPGEHTIEIRREGYRSTTRRAVVVAGERKEVDVTLDVDHGLFSRWWFWTGVGVVVAGGVALAVATQAERSPEPGTVAPGVVTGGLSAAGIRF